MVWTELEINAKRVLIGNILFHPTRLDKYNHVLDRFLEDQRDNKFITLGDFHAQNTLRDKHINQE